MLRLSWPFSFRTLAELVRSALPEAVISAVNYSEVLKKTIERCPTGPLLLDMASPSSRLTNHSRPPAPSSFRKPKSTECPSRIAPAWRWVFERRLTVLRPSARCGCHPSYQSEADPQCPLKLTKARSTASDETIAPAVLPPADPTPRALMTVAALADIPEEDIWLAKQKSKRTRRAYKLDVQHFMRTLNIRSYDELRQVDHRAVIAWERIMREIDKAAPSTVRRRLAALSSLFKHLVRHDHAEKNPVSEVERRAINREEGTTSPSRNCRPASFSTPLPMTPSKGSGTAPSCPWACRSASPRRDCGAQSRGSAPEPRFDSLRVVRKGGRHEARAINSVYGGGTADQGSS